jgi:hypothetical protein
MDSLLHGNVIVGCGFLKGGKIEKKTSSLDEVLGVLRKWKSEVKAIYGVTAIGVFGSLARGVATPDSDVDVVIKMIKPDLLMIVGIKYIVTACLTKKKHYCAAFDQYVCKSAVILKYERKIAN